MILSTDGSVINRLLPGSWFSAECYLTRLSAYSEVFARAVT